MATKKTATKKLTTKKTVTKTAKKTTSTKKPAAKKAPAKKTATATKKATKPTGLTVGSKAPTFTLPTDSGMVTLGALRGQNVVLYFYPKDDTPGCTVQACGFRDNLPKFKNLNATIIGLSRDSVASHQKFKKKYSIPFALASDEKEKVCNAYGVMVDKNMYGKKVRGIERSTFIIDGTGTIRALWRKVDVEGHADEVRTALQAMGKDKTATKTVTKKAA